MFTRMFVVVIALTLFVSVSSQLLAYETVAGKGFVGYVTSAPEKFVIPGGQGSGQLRYKKEFHCQGHYGPEPPDAIHARVESSQGYVEVVIKDSLENVSIYRLNGSEGDVIVFLSLSCGFNPTVYNQNSRSGADGVLLPAVSRSSEGIWF